MNIHDIHVPDAFVVGFMYGYLLAALGALAIAAIARAKGEA